MLGSSSRGSAPTTWCGARTRSGPARRGGRSRRLRRLEIPEDMQQKHGFAPLGPADGPVKRAIFGEDSARLYGYDRRAELSTDRIAVAQGRTYEREGPGRTNRRSGTWRRHSPEVAPRDRRRAAFTERRPGVTRAALQPGAALLACLLLGTALRGASPGPATRRPARPRRAGGGGGSRRRERRGLRDAREARRRRGPGGRRHRALPRGRPPAGRAALL